MFRPIYPYCHGNHVHHHHWCHNYHNHHCHHDGDALSEINTGSPVYNRTRTLDNKENLLFDLSFIYQLDGMFLHNSFNYLSIDQERFMKEYLYEGGKVTDALNNENINDLEAFDELSEVMVQLDNVLANFKHRYHGCTGHNRKDMYHKHHHFHHCHFHDPFGRHHHAW